MTKPKGTADLQEQICSTVIGTQTPNPPASNTTGLFQAAVEAIRSGDEVAALECLRQLDEPQPRKILPYLQLLVAEHDRLSPVIESGEGMAARSEQLDRARRMLAKTLPTDGADAEKLATDAMRLDREYHKATSLASDAENAIRQTGAIEALCPLLFGLPASRQNASAGGLGPASIMNWPRVNGHELTFKDGWVYSRMQSPSPAPRRRLIAR